MANEELLALSSVEMRRRIGTKEISPVELLEASLQQIERINPADLVVLDAPDAIMALRTVAPVLAAYKRGRRTVTREPVRLHRP